MLKKVAVSVGVATVLVGSGTAAYAAHAAPAASSSTTSSTTSTAGPRAAGAKAHHKNPFQRAAHAQWVTVSKKGTVTHQAIRGVVTAVSPTSITIEAADSTSESFSVSGTTKVHLKGAGSATTGSVSGVKVGDRAQVVGTGTTSYAAMRVLDRGAPKAGAVKPGSSAT